MSWSKVSRGVPFSIVLKTGKANQRASLAWIELNTVIAKLHFTYDLELLNQDLDWHRDSRMATLWQKPELRVRVTPWSKKPVC